MFDAMFSVAVLSLIEAVDASSAASSATCLALSAASAALSLTASAPSAALSATADAAEPAASAALPAASATCSLTSLTVVAGTGAGVGVTGDGVFQGSSTGLEAFHAATPAATAAAITPKTSQPRFFLGSGWDS